MNLDDLSIVFFINDIYHLNMPGNVLLFRVLRQSTIGAEGLDFRVRNGIGYYPFAIITRQLLYTYYKLIVNNDLN